ncbi:SDR family NAD(P)-dependent oxidoreductase [Streptomyces ficellus]|uniref:SDR family NAD(P)-dependent oxidoreductase n=1 Tax=Streptomyces ficellus TaxID=1977088 RepID=A0ABT7YZY5_9ACTN|nr:SDR family NAD(P)-dependent oxidoreductase [Streptomyces ficellus]MDN3292804.1 SDR family NAD(P)-dependent oxidoreductase [Streptomyces ficellus]
MRFSQLPDMVRKCFVLLEDKTVVVYGVTAAHSAAIIRAFAGQRALIFLADSSRAKAEAAARQIIDAGAVAEASQVDLSDHRQIEEYTAELAEWTGGIDVAVVALEGENADAQLTAATMVAERMAAHGSGIIVIMSAADGSEREYWQFAERAAADGVAVLPVFGTPNRGQSLNVAIDHPILS